jgi:hypothetical protein
MAKTIYTGAEFHLALVTDSLFSRGWCLWELAVRYRSEKDTSFLRSSNSKLMQQPTSNGNFLECMIVSKESDRQSIIDEILSIYQTSKKFNTSMTYVLRSAGGKPHSAA